VFLIVWSGLNTSIVSTWLVSDSQVGGQFDPGRPLVEGTPDPVRRIDNEYLLVVLRVHHDGVNGSPGYAGNVTIEPLTR